MRKHMHKNAGRLPALLLAAAMAAGLMAPVTAFAAENGGGGAGQSGRYSISEDNPDPALRHGDDCLRDIKLGGQIVTVSPGDEGWPGTPGPREGLEGHMDGACYKLTDRATMPGDTEGDPGQAGTLDPDGDTGERAPSNIYKAPVRRQDVPALFGTGRPDGDGAGSDDGTGTVSDDPGDGISPADNPNGGESGSGPKLLYGANPKFTVQYYGHLDMLNMDGEGLDAASFVALPVIDTSGRVMPKNGTGAPNTVGTDTLPSGNPLKNIYVTRKSGSDNGGTVQTKAEFRELYKQNEYEYYKAPSINYFDELVDNPGYKIMEMWVTNDPAVAEGVDRDAWTVYENMRRDGTSYYYTADGIEKALHFTNRAEAAKDGSHVLLDEDTIVRLVYDQVNEEQAFNAAFYDYDITDGYVYKTQEAAIANKGLEANDAPVPVDPVDPAEPVDPAVPGESGTGNAGGEETAPAVDENAKTYLASEVGDKDKNTWWVNTFRHGINSPENYDMSNGGARLGFGNMSLGTGIGRETAVIHGNVNYINGGNAYANKTQWALGSACDKVTKSSYGGVCFGLVTGFDKDTGRLYYADGIVAPNLFGNKDIPVGRTDYTNGEYGLGFKQNGDTYTLSSVTGTDTAGLENFGFSFGKWTAGEPDSSKWPKSYSNLFWPMDSAPSFGADGHDVKFGDNDVAGKRMVSGYNYEAKKEDTRVDSLPVADGGQKEHHNAYFGMHYAVSFDLAEDYVGPLEYVFFGDDDMWVFLSSEDSQELVIDIGGVHSAVGEYVDLWDYIPGGRENHASRTYTLDFYYTERGAAGSTCWMQFTLPSVTSGTIENRESDYADLRVDKKVVGKAPDGGQFKFKLSLSDRTGAALADDYSYIVVDANGKVTSDYGLVLHTGSEFTLEDGCAVVVKYLPEGTKYSIIETDSKNAQETTMSMGVQNKGETKTRIATGMLADIGGTAGLDKNTEGVVHFTNYYTLDSLPATGGEGTGMLVLTGICGLALGYVVLSLARRRREGA